MGRWRNEHGSEHRAGQILEALASGAGAPTPAPYLLMHGNMAELRTPKAIFGESVTSVRFLDAVHLITYDLVGRAGMFATGNCYTITDAARLLLSAPATGDSEMPQ